MSSNLNIRPAIQTPSCILDIGPDKGKLSGFVITTLVLATLATAYFICGFTSLPQISPVFASLSGLTPLNLTVVVISWGSLSIASMTVLILIHQKIKKSLEPQMQRAIQQLDQLAVDCEVQQEHLTEIRKILTNGYSNYLDYYGFYYRLSKISKGVKDDPERAKEWRDFLRQIHGEHFYSEEGEKHATIDCSIELDRIEGKQPKLHIEKLSLETPTLENDLMAINEICKEAFATWDYDDNVHNLAAYFFTKQHTPYVVRSSNSGDVVAVIVLREQKAIEEGKKELFIHTLARKASAVDLGMTEKFKEHLSQNIDQSQYARVWCHVRSDNKPAQYIYKKLGFKFVSQSGAHWNMVYQPEEI